MDALARLLAEHACARVAVGFFHALDRRDYASVVALMADGGVWKRQGAELAAPEAIAAALRARPATLTTRHLVSNVVVRLVDETSASVAYELSVFLQDGDKPPRQTAILTGEDRLEKIGAVWRIRLKEAKPIFTFA